MNAVELTLALDGKWHRRYGIARCPAHEDRSPSLSVKDGKGGKLLVKCHGGCSQAAVIAALYRLGLWPDRAENQGEDQHRRQDRTREQEERHRAAFVEQLWRQTWNNATPARSSLIETWLRARGIPPERLDLERLPLRWAAHCSLGKGSAPALVALMTTAIGNEPVGIHRTFLTSDGSAKAFGKQSRKMLGHAGIVRLSPDDEVELGLGICEGVETGLAIMAAGWAPVWACGSLGALQRFPVLGGVESLTIFSDPKPQEIEGARACAARWRAARKEALVRLPNAKGDFNDVLAKEFAA